MQIQENVHNLYKIISHAGASCYQRGLGWISLQAETGDNFTTQAVRVYEEVRDSVGGAISHVGSTSSNALCTIAGEARRCGIIGLACVVVGAEIYWLYRTWHLRIVEVQNTDHIIEVGILRTHFERHLPGAGEAEQLPEVEIGKHLRTAAERRANEFAVFSVFKRVGCRFRDVGGSRVRHPQFSALKHNCIPTLDSADIWRNAKYPSSPFDSCNGLAQHCPVKSSFPGAALIHSDYYLSSEDLAAVIRSHTFIVTHPFDGEEGCFNDELHWRKEGPYIRAWTDDGTPYKHLYHHWEAEGCIIGRHGAATYVRVHRGPSMDVYYCFPSPGVYRSDDPLRLRRSDEVLMHRLPSGNFYSVTNGSAKIYDPDFKVLQEIPHGILQRVAARCGTAVRDEKFLPALVAYTTTRFTADNQDLHVVEDVISVALRHSDMFALNVSSRYITNFDPMRITNFQRLVWVWNDLRSSLRGYWRLPLTTSNPLVNRVTTPWAFSRISVNSYVRFTHYGLVDVTDHRPMHRPFRDDRGQADAGANNSEHHGASDLPGEPSSQLGHTSTRTEASAGTISDVYEDARDDSCNAGNVTPTLTDEIGGQVSGDGLEVSAVALGADGVESQGRGGHDRSPNLKVIGEDRPGTIGGRRIVLETNPHTGNAERIWLPLLDDPIEIPPTGVGSFTEENIKQNYRHLVRAAERGPESARSAVHDHIRTFDRNPRHTTQTISFRVSGNGRDGVVHRDRRAHPVRNMGKEVRPEKEGRTEGGPKSPRGRRIPNAGSREGEKLRQVRDNRQVRGSPEHQPERGRVPCGRGAIHRSDRAGGQERRVPGKRALPKEEGH
uniref:Chroparavirus methyltransferase domain-containing protein n=1 Tax=Linepithema humile C virus 1 TaxID=2259784 RepID=A0A2Z4Z3N2_9VIRU|nr:hypothetical protein [Linepithema humile C virus 1]